MRMCTANRRRFPTSSNVLACMAPSSSVPLSTLVKLERSRPDAREAPLLNTQLVTAADFPHLPKEH